MTNQPQIRENSEQMGVCNTNKGCCGGNRGCCSGGSFRASLGRIFFGVLLLLLVFFAGLKMGVDGNMNMKGGRGMGMGMGNGCMMGGYMNNRVPMQQVLPTAPVANQVVAPTPTEEEPATEPTPTEEDVIPVVIDEETLPE